MSEIISIDMPDAVLDRFRRAAAGARRPVQELLVNALANFIPLPDSPKISAKNWKLWKAFLMMSYDHI